MEIRYLESRSQRVETMSPFWERSGRIYKCLIKQMVDYLSVLPLSMLERAREMGRGKPG